MVDLARQRLGEVADLHVADLTSESFMCLLFFVLESA